MFHLKFFSTRMAGDPFLAYGLVTLLTIPADIASIFCIHYVKRRQTVFVCFALTGLFTLALMYLEDGVFSDFQPALLYCQLLSEYDGAALLDSYDLEGVILSFVSAVSFTTRVILCTLAKMFNSMGSSVLGVFASESFPTVIRAMGKSLAFQFSS